MSDIAWQPVTVALSRLTPWERNPKRISKAHASRLLDLWQRLGQFQTIAIGPAGEVYDGHQRLSVLKAAHGAGYEVQALQSSRALSEKEREELTVAAHVGTVGQFDWDALSGWDADNLQSWGFDAETLANWQTDIGALSLMLASEEEPPPDDPGAQVDKAEELREKWGVNVGDLWQLGDHRLMCGDCTDAAVVARVMGGERAGCCVTDPPYGQNQEDVPHDAPHEHAELMIACVREMPIDNGVVIAFQSPRMFPNWLAAIVSHEFRRALWLYKEAQETFPWHGWIMKSEMILVSEIGKGEWLEVHPYAHDCYKVSEVSFRTEQIAAVRPHGSVKPLSVIQDLVSRVGGLVYEPFLGSGTTLIACERLGRRCRAVEISPGYVAVALQRFYDMTGIEPVLLEPGNSDFTVISNG